MKSWRGSDSPGVPVPKASPAGAPKSPPLAESPEREPAEIIGRIGPANPSQRVQIAEVAIDPLEEAERQAAQEYASLLNRKLSIRHRANLMVKIAKNIKGGNAALALKAIQDINLATGVVTKQGNQVDLGPMFVLPPGDDVAVK
jgi:hypothetical protein